MIEQEKAVQFRFDTGEKGLSERLSDLDLPEFVRLYFCVGLPNMFAWKNAEKTESFQETWLYIPNSTLESVIAAKGAFQKAPGPDSFPSDSIRLEKKELFPVVSGGKVICFLAVPEGKSYAPSASDLEKIERVERTTQNTEKSGSIQIAYEFIDRLFDCKQSYSEFAGRLMEFLTDQVDKSYVGIYWQGDDGFHRRWAYGDLQLSDKLQLSISNDNVELWRETIAHGGNFIPAERVQDEPVLVHTPPSFLFIHRTPDFGDRAQWLAMAVPGDISAAAISRITIIASLLSSLNEDRATGYTEVVRLFGDLVNRDQKSLLLEDALKNCFRILDGKLRLNSLCLLDTDNSVLSCSKQSDDVVRTDKSKITKVPDDAYQVIETHEPAYLEGPSHSQRERTLHQVHKEESHAFFPVPIKNGTTALLSLEFTSGLGKAKSCQILIGLLAKYIGICISLSRTEIKEKQYIGTVTDELSESLALERLRTISKMNTGYFHELIEHLSVILGQAELLDYDIKASTKPVTVESLLMSTERIVRAAGSLAGRLEELKEVSTLKVIESGSKIPAAEFVAMLPGLTYGYYLAVKDSKNVEVEVQTKTDQNTAFAIPVLHIFDFMLPLIFTIMDESICSGRIAVTLAEHFGRPVLRISYPKKLLGKMRVEKLIDRVFKNYRLENSDNGALIVSVENAHFIFSESEGDRYQAIYSLTNEQHPVEEFN